MVRLQRRHAAGDREGGEAEIEIGGMEIRVQYHFLPNDPEVFPYDTFSAQEVHFKGVHLKQIDMGTYPKATITWIDVKDLLEEVNGDLSDLLQEKLDDLQVEYRPNDRLVDE